VRLTPGSRANFLVAYAHRIQSSSFSQFRGLTKRAIYNKSYKVVRRIRLALYCALGERRVDLVGSGDLGGKVFYETRISSELALVEFCVDGYPRF
jgi:hypothetical protein